MLPFFESLESWFLNAESENVQFPYPGDENVRLCELSMWVYLNECTKDWKDHQRHEVYVRPALSYIQLEVIVVLKSGSS